MSSERIPQTKESWMSRPLELLTLVVVRFPTLILLVAGIAVAASLWLTTTRLGFHTSRAELLNPKSEFNRRWIEYTKEFGEKEDVVIVVEGENRDQVIPAIDDVCRCLAQQSQLFAAVMHELDAPKLRQKGLYYLKTEDLLKIDGFLDQAGPMLQGDWSQLNLGSMGRWMNAAMTSGSDVQRQQMLMAMQKELPRMMNGLTAAFGPSGQYQSPWPDMNFSSPLTAQSASPRLMAEDGKMGFVLLKLLEEDKQGFAQNNESINALRRLAAEVMARHPDTKIGLTGLPIIEYDEMKSSEQSMSAATIISFVGVFLVIVIAFGGLRHSFMAMTALVVGMILACGCITLTVGHVTILSIAFGSILFGLGIDYGIYYVSRYLELRETVDSVSDALVETASSAGPGITMGALTSAIAFFAAGFTDFPGVAQLGIVAGGGILLCWVAQMTILPAMIRLFDTGNTHWNLPIPLNLLFWFRPLFAMPRLVLTGTVIGTVVLAVGIHYVGYDYNLLNMQPAGLESVKLEHKLTQQTGNSSWFALSIADTPEKVAEKKEKFLKLSSVDRVEEVATKIPSDAKQKQPLIARIHQRLANLPQQVPQIAVTSQLELAQMLGGVQQMLSAMPGNESMLAGFQQFGQMLQNMPAEEYQRRISAYQQAMATDLLTRLQMLQAVSCPELPQYTDLPEGVRSRAIGKNGRYLMRVYSKTNIWDVEANKNFVNQIRTVDAEATGNPLQVYEATKQMKQSFESAAWYALLAITPIVLLDFRRIGHGLLSALPMGVGLLQTLGLMGLLDVPLNPANIIMLPFMLGIGMESGINLIHDMRRQKGDYRGPGNDVMVAVVVNSLTTMVGFGALMIANHQGLQSLGRVLTIAMGCCLFNSLILPNLLLAGHFADNIGSSKEKEEDLEPESVIDKWYNENDEPIEKFVEDDYYESDRAAA
jgi:hopanoid biosynthesis associated RND transporter like protein HpnN